MNNSSFIILFSVFAWVSCCADKTIIKAVDYTKPLKIVVDIKSFDTCDKLETQLLGIPTNCEYKTHSKLVFDFKDSLIILGDSLFIPIKNIKKIVYRGRFINDNCKKYWKLKYYDVQHNQRKLKLFLGNEVVRDMCFECSGNFVLACQKFNILIRKNNLGLIAAYSTGIIFIAFGGGWSMVL